MLVSIWQVRGSRFSLPLACVPLSIWVAGWRRHAETAPGVASSLKLAGAWLVSFNVTWILAALGIWYLFASAETVEQLAKEKCYKQTDYAQLGRDAGRKRAGHLQSRRAGVALHAAPRARRTLPPQSSTATLPRSNAFIETPEKAGEIARANNIGLVAFCRGNPETAFLAKRAPDGLLAGLLAGKTPDWMEIVPESRGKPLELYRVLPQLSGLSDLRGVNNHGISFNALRVSLDTFPKRFTGKLRGNTE